MLNEMAKQWQSDGKVWPSATGSNGEEVVCSLGMKRFTLKRAYVKCDKKLESDRQLEVRIWSRTT